MYVYIYIYIYIYVRIFEIGLLAGTFGERPSELSRRWVEQLRPRDRSGRLPSELAVLRSCDIRHTTCVYTISCMSIYIYIYICHVYMLP